MLPCNANVPQHPAPSPPPPARIGVGIDTSRYGHYAVFLRDDLQAAAPDLQFVESASGYAQLRERLQQIAQPHANVTFVVRLDAAGQYADNLLHFLHGLGKPQPAGAVRDAGSSSGDASRVAYVISTGDPQRNKNYRAALFGAKKSDPVEARAAARFALNERPASVTPLSPELRTLRQVAGRLQAAVRHRTRLINQFHQLLTLSFPELALLVKDISCAWVLELCTRYPTAQRLAAASPSDLENIPYLPHPQIDALLQHARTSIASLAAAAVADLVGDQVRQLRDATARKKRLEIMLAAAYHQLPQPNHLDTIPGIGDLTAAILSAFILDIERFETPNQLVAYFGAMPVEVGRGVDRDGKPRAAKRYVMSQRGNDLVRRYLWMAALSAIRHNPAVRALYARVVAKNPDKKAKAIGHAMRKLLHLAFAIWKSGKPFDKAHYPWNTPAHVDAEPELQEENRAGDTPMSSKEQAAGHNPDEPEKQVVTAACSITSTPSNPVALALGDSKTGAERESPDRTATFLDFAHLKRQLPMTRVLDHLGLSSRLRGNAPQKRGPCPIHRADGRGRTFSVNLDEHVFCCFDQACAKKGDVIDLWASVKSMSLREAALDLVETFGLEPTPPHGTEKRHG
jgi:transposase